MADPAPRVRLDKWLWAARCFKTRSMAAAACKGSLVRVNGGEAKASLGVKAGDLIEARTPGGVRVLEVAGLAERRGSADVAATLFVDHTPPPPPPPPLSPMLRDRGTGRPTKRDRRRIQRLMED